MNVNYWGVDWCWDLCIFYSIIDFRKKENWKIKFRIKKSVAKYAIDMILIYESSFWEMRFELDGKKKPWLAIYCFMSWKILWRMEIIGKNIFLGGQTESSKSEIRLNKPKIDQTFWLFPRATKIFVLKLEMILRFFNQKTTFNNNSSFSFKIKSEMYVIDRYTSM